MKKTEENWYQVMVLNELFNNFNFPTNWTKVTFKECFIPHTGKIKMSQEDQRSIKIITDSRRRHQYQLVPIGTVIHNFRISLYFVVVLLNSLVLH